MTLSTVLQVAIIICTALIVSGVIYRSHKKDEKIPWEDVGTIVLVHLARLKKVEEIKKLGYQAMEDYAVKMIHEDIQDSRHLSKKEKALMNEDIIRTFVGPHLKKIHEAEKKA